MSFASGLGDPLLLFDSDDRDGTNDTEVTTHLAPLPPVTLPAFPGATASPSSSKLSLRSSGPPTPSSVGLDMNKSWPTSPSRQQSFGQTGGDELEEDVARARQERLARRSQTSSGTPSASGGAASARANILNLAASGGGAKSTEGGPPSLASFMGGGAKPPRLHRVGTGPTEEEREETERLEREMAATKQRWGSKAESAGPPAGGMSLASLLKGGLPSASAGTSSPAASSVATRWQPQERIKSKSAPAPMMTFGTADNTLSQTHVTPRVLSSATFTAPPRSRTPSPAGRKPISIRPVSPNKVLPSSGDQSLHSPTKASSLPPRPSSPNRAFPFSSINLDKSTPPAPERSSSNPQPRSLAAMFGSTATGPRLNQQTPQHEVEEGPAHARPKGLGGVAMPGMVAADSVRARAESLTASKTPTPTPTAPPLVEAKIVSRSPPADEQDDDMYSPPLHQDSSPLLPDSPPSLRSTRPESALMSPELPSSPESIRSTSAFAKTSSHTDSLTRLQSSNIVADRLKWGEEKEKAAASPTGSGASSPVVAGRPAHSKRNSVMERWGRDVPNGSNESPPSSGWTPPVEVRAAKPLAERWPEKKEQSALSSAGPALVHMNHGRARPPKSTPRGSATTGSAASSPSLPPGSPAPAQPTSNADEPSPPAVASAPSPQAEPTTKTVTESVASKQPVTERWAHAAPIGVKEPGKVPSTVGKSSMPSTDTSASKHTRGVALPGMSAPPSSSPAPSQAGIGIGIFQHPDTAATPDAMLSKLSEPETSSKVEHDDGFPRFKDPFRAPANPQPTGTSSPIAPWSKPSKQNSLQNVSAAQSSTSANRAHSLPPGPASPSSVRNAVASWGSPKKVSSSYNSSSVKESYGVKVASQACPSPPAQPDFRPSPAASQSSGAPSVPPQQKTTVIQEASTSGPATPRLVQIADTESQMSRQTSGDSTFTDAHEGLSPRERQSSIAATHRESIDRVVELAKSPVLSPRVPGDSLGLDVYNLSTGEADPIDHNHVFYQTEILAIISRTSLMGGKEVAKMWIWVGEEAREFDDKINERARKVAQAYSTTPTLIRYRFEPRELVEAFGDQITICRGTRDDFNHLDIKLYTVQSHEDVVFVEEVQLTSKNICSGYCAVFSLVGEVYAWLGSGSLPLEQEACEEFADTISDGRHVTVLREGSETAYFWHGLDGLEYASAHYWRFRATHPQKVAVVGIDSTATPIVSRVESLELSSTSISLIDGGFSEHWIIVPAAARSKRADLSIALEAADELAALWKQRGFAFRQPYHVLLFPTLIPRDLPHLARQLDFAKLSLGYSICEAGQSNRKNRSARLLTSVLSLVAKLSTLKAELKAWEASFRASHGGQDPSKADIKADPAIAAKYKEYSKLKTTKAVPRAPSASVHPSSSTSDASTSTARAAPALPSNVFKTPTKPKPSKHVSQAGTTSPAKSAAGTGEGGPTYVIANSPSKLRALAAAHSTFGSPNRSSSHAAAAGLSGSKEHDGLSVVGSPKKYNPFAVGNSPTKKSSFAAQLGQKKKEKERGLGKGKTREGVGWGSSDATRGWESMFASSGPTASSSRRMDEDEEMDETMDDDYAAMIKEALGPSPVKSTTGRRKEFKPLFEVATQPAFPQPPPPPPKPKPFSTEFRFSRKPDPPAPKGDRGLKRAPTPPLEEQTEQSDDDEFDGEGKDSKAKRKKVVVGGKAKGKTAVGKGRKSSTAKKQGGGMDEHRIAPTLVLDLEAGEAGDKINRIVLQPSVRAEPTQRDSNVMDEDGGQVEEELKVAHDHEYQRDPLLDLLHPRAAVRSVTPPEPDDDDGFSAQPRPPAHHSDASVTLPAELATILSLRSPVKKARQKGRDSRLEDFLKGPGTKKEVKGLEDLEEARIREEKAEEQVVEDSDDDWQSDTDGRQDSDDGVMDRSDAAW